MQSFISKCSFSCTASLTSHFCKRLKSKVREVATEQCSLWLLQTHAALDEQMLMAGGHAEVVFSISIYSVGINILMKSLCTYARCLNLIYLKPISSGELIQLFFWGNYRISHKRCAFSLRVNMHLSKANNLKW